MQFNFPRPSSQFERDLIIQLTKYLSDMSNKLDRFSGSTWDGPHPVIGSFHFWVSASKKWMMKEGQPTSDSDGVVVGTQT